MINMNKRFLLLGLLLSCGAVIISQAQRFPYGQPIIVPTTGGSGSSVNPTGDASGLTNIPAEQLVGTIPNAALTNVTVSNANFYSASVPASRFVYTDSTGKFNGTANSVGSASLSQVLSDETGTGTSVFNTSPTFQSSVSVNGNLSVVATTTLSSGVTYPSNTLTMAQASGQFTNGGHWTGTISNTFYVGYMSNNVAVFTNLWSH